MRKSELMANGPYVLKGLAAFKDSALSHSSEAQYGAVVVFTVSGE